MRPRHPFNNPAPSGSAASWPAAPMASANAGARSSVSRPISPSTCFSSSRANAMRPRSCEPAIVPPRSSKVSLLAVSDAREDRLIFCASESEGCRLNSGARLTPRTARLTLALGSAPHGSAVPCASASNPAPDILAFSRSGARHTPATDPSNCAAPSPPALARIEIYAAHRRDFGLCSDRGNALELRRVELEPDARVGAIGPFGALVNIERQFKTRRARLYRIEPRGQCRRERRDQGGDLAERCGT